MLIKNKDKWSGKVKIFMINVDDNQRKAAEMMPKEEIQNVNHYHRDHSDCVRAYQA